MIVIKPRKIVVVYFYINRHFYRLVEMMNKNNHIMIVIKPRKILSVHYQQNTVNG